MRPTRALKTPGMAIGAAVQASRKRRPGEAEPWDESVMCCPLSRSRCLFSEARYHCQGFPTSPQRQQGRPLLALRAGQAGSIRGFFMSDATPRTRPSLILWTSLALFGLFAVQVAYQYYNVNRVHIDVDTDLSAELAEATLIEEEPAPASDGWPQWRGPHRDGVVRAPDLLTDWPDDGPAQLWQARIGDGYSSFAVRDGRVYTLFQQGGQEVVQCWRAEDGKEVWHHSYDCPHAPADYPGPRSTPTLDGDRVYTVGSAGTFLCLDAANGSPHWKHELLAEFHTSPPKWGIAFSPLIDGDLVFTSPGGRGGNSLAAFNKTTGELVWKALDDPAGYSSPIAATIAGV